MTTRSGSIAVEARIVAGRAAVAAPQEVRGATTVDRQALLRPGHVAGIISNSVTEIGVRRSNCKTRGRRTADHRSVTAPCPRGTPRVKASLAPAGHRMRLAGHTRSLRPMHRLGGAGLALNHKRYRRDRCGSDGALDEGHSPTPVSLCRSRQEDGKVSAVSQLYKLSEITDTGADRGDVPGRLAAPRGKPTGNGPLTA